MTFVEFFIKMHVDIIEWVLNVPGGVIIYVIWLVASYYLTSCLKKWLQLDTWATVFIGK